MISLSLSALNFDFGNDKWVGNVLNGHETNIKMQKVYKAGFIFFMQNVIFFMSLLFWSKTKSGPVLGRFQETHPIAVSLSANKERNAFSQLHSPYKMQNSFK